MTFREKEEEEEEEKTSGSEVAVATPEVTKETSFAKEKSSKNHADTPVSIQVEDEDEVADSAAAAAAALQVDTTSATTPSQQGGTSSVSMSTSTSKSQHEFQPGDHVIRWEMLPIAWPIQIHGIVLSVNENTVVLVDFGLAATPQQQQEQEHASSAVTGPAPPSAAAMAAATAAVSTPSEPMESEGNGVEEYKEEPPPETPVAQTETETESGATQDADDTTKRKPSFFSSNPAEVEQARKDWMKESSKTSQKILKSFTKLHPNKDKQRLNVVVLEQPSEWKKWKKVNYEGGLFGLGGGSSNRKGSDDDDEDNASNPGGKPKKWFSKFSFASTASSKAQEDEPTEANSDDEASKTESQAETNDKASSSWWPSRGGPRSSPKDHGPTSAVSEGLEWEKEDDEDAATETSKKRESTDEKKPSTNTTSTSWWKKVTPGLSSSTTDSQVNDQGVNGKSNIKDPKESTATPSTTLSWENRCMNPAMAKLMNKKPSQDTSDEDNVEYRGLLFKNGIFKRKVSSSSTQKDAKSADGTSAESPTDGAEAKIKNDLPKADPPKLVLARTRWLLEHGDSILPPYHAFHSNSECIAVFCKTGYWSNLQADVFLHSTAIGNAKTMGVATMGVAASVPFLAPVIGLAGLGMVAAPWLVLHSSKRHADDITQKMNDQFWAQAEPEVFVECIEHWSKIEKYYELKAQHEKRKQQQQQQQPAPTVVSQVAPPSRTGTGTGTDCESETKKSDPRVISL